MDSPVVSARDFDPAARSRPAGPTHVVVAGETCDDFTGTDYLSIARGDEAIANCRDYLKVYGISASASRKTSGNYEVFGELERVLAAFVGCDAALLFSSGFLANVAAARFVGKSCQGWLVDPGSHLSFIGHLDPALSIVDCVRHGDRTVVPESLGWDRGARIGLFADTLSPISGRRISLSDVRQFLDQWPNAIAVLDESHAIGVLGAHGRGAASELLRSPHRHRLLITGTLSKALGHIGGFVAGPLSIINELRDRSFEFAGSTPVPAFIAASAVKVLQDTQALTGRLRALRRNILLMRTQLAGGSVAANHDAEVPIFGLDFTSQNELISAIEWLRSQRIAVQAISAYGSWSRPRLRWIVQSAHLQPQIRRFGAALWEISAGTRSHLAAS